MILLQTGGYVTNFGAGNVSPLTFVYIALGLAGVAAVIFVGTLISRRARPSATESAERISSAIFRREAKRVGLTPSSAEVLENLVRMCKVKQPLMVFSSASLLDDTLKKGLYSLDNSRDLSVEDKESRRATIFQIKQTIERNGAKGAVLRSTNLLKPGQLLTITPEGASAYSSKVISNMKDFLTVSAPAQPAGADTRWMRGTPLSVYLWRDNDAGYSFVSKVLGYDTVKGIPSVLIQHSRTLRREQRRRNRRREIMRQCFYYPIRIVETGQGRKMERKASVEQSMRTLGIVVDLSAGGCAIQTMNPFERGKLAMVEFDIDRTAPIRAFGKVLNVHRQKGRGGIMHIMFTRVTRQHLNKISEFVYDFSRPTTTAQVRQQMDRAAPGRAMKAGRPPGGPSLPRGNSGGSFSR
jgi:c-di-GMP-binding flagellar brake protein YcgR